MKSVPLHRSGRAVLSPEDYRRQRRGRRMERTARLETQVRAWAEQHGCSLRVLNEGHHWLLQRPGFMAEWWPSSARLAVNREYGTYLHAPHWADAVSVLRQQLTVPQPSQSGLSIQGSAEGPQ